MARLKYVFVMPSPIRTLDLLIWTSLNRCGGYHTSILGRQRNGIPRISVLLSRFANQLLCEDSGRLGLAVGE
jgi:hypothetical protein